MNGEFPPPVAARGPACSIRNRAVTWAREMAGLTKRALAACVGISEQLIGEIESGWRSATRANLGKIAEALNCPLVAPERRRHHIPSER
ncbi:helix-turn-helix domain-containing protein [Streptomyces sp. NBC_00448]|uniref:helix-turn-helix domain-containing protein n=1 Tax=Streptomyces sp. NBC_00448 TaxID=2903652 RepID=UPI002E1A89C1